MVFCLGSCVHGPDAPSQFDAYLKTQEDVRQLNNLEAQLTITPEKDRKSVV